MRFLIFAFAYILLSSLTTNKAFAQNGNDVPVAENDTIVPKEPIIFTPSSASNYIQKLMRFDNLWRPHGDTMRISLSRLMDHYNEPIDSVRNRLYRFNYDSVTINRTFIARHDTIPVRWLNDSTFILNSLNLEKDPFVIKKTVIVNSVDTSAFNYRYGLPNMRYQMDSLLHFQDTITEIIIDSLLLEARKIQLYKIVDNTIVPPLAPRNRSFRFISDSTKLVQTESSRVNLANPESPFLFVPNELTPDSLKHAIITLFSYTEVRDSILLFFDNQDGRKTPFWLSSNADELYRFWVKNQGNDSITIWIGNPTKYDITLTLEDNVNVERRERMRVDDVPITTLRPQRTLLGLKPLQEIPVYWDYGLASAFTLNQNHFTNWSRGGENSLASMLDVGASAKYTNKEARSHWTSTGRLRYGSIWTKEHGLRTNTDALEFNSQFNKVLRGKVDFSSVLYFKTQIAKGYRNPADTIPISKFLNPGTFTVGVGIEYKPHPKTSLNFSPLSYRNTFVLDTANINQRAHGIDIDKRARQEMGGQLVIRNSMTILDGLNMTNAVRLFSGYLDKPKNVDVDWEISLDKQISWFFMVRLNLHLIYDDDIRFAVEDSEGQPVLMPDGSPKRVAKTQFKQFLGLTLSFRI